MKVVHQWLTGMAQEPETDRVFSCRWFALHCPIMRIPIDHGAVAPVERFAIEF